MLHTKLSIFFKKTYILNSIGEILTLICALKNVTKMLKNFSRSIYNQLLYLNNSYTSTLII